MENMSKCSEPNVPKGLDVRPGESGRPIEGRAGFSRMHYSTVYCPAHGLFSHNSVVDYSCPKCGRPGEPLPVSFAGLQDRLEILVDPQMPVKALLSLRQIAFAAHAGLLTPEEAAKGASHIVAHCADLFTVSIPGNLYAEIAEALGEVLKARFTGARSLRP
jgi:hypothetical protein